MAEIDESTLRADLEVLGEAEVRKRAAMGLYGTSNKKRRYVDQWLDQLVRSRSDASQAEQIDIARSAKDAAWAAADAAREAAREARTANTIAKVALASAIVAIVVSIVGFFVN